MAQYNEVYEIEAAILTGLIPIMENAITVEASHAIREAAMEKVYSYPSQFKLGVNPDPRAYQSRRYASGGLADISTYEANYHPNIQELSIEVKTPWQNIGFRHTTGEGTGGNELADVIENNRMYHAPKRPFIKRAEQIIKSNHNRLEEIIVKYLDRTI